MIHTLTVIRSFSHVDCTGYFCSLIPLLEMFLARGFHLAVASMTWSTPFDIGARNLKLADGRDFSWSNSSKRIQSI